MREFTMHGRHLTEASPAYVIAEIGHNHGGSVKTACRMIQMAGACGADAAKFQKRDIDTLYTRAMLEAPYANEQSFGRTYGEHRRALELGARDYSACQAVAKTAGIDFFATAFDEPSADFLLGLGVPAIKLASSSVTDRPLLSYVARLGTPIILSTGGATWADVDAAVNLLSGARTPFAVLHCTAAYPVLNMAELNLRAITVMRERYPETIIGWSGHDPGVSLALVAYAYGARIIEKHVTLNRASKGTDHAFSLEPRGLATLCEDLEKAAVATGDGVKRLYESERKPLARMRRVQTNTGEFRVTGELDALA